MFSGATGGEFVVNIRRIRHLAIYNITLLRQLIKSTFQPGNINYRLNGKTLVTLPNTQSVIGLGVLLVIQAMLSVMLLFAS